MIKISAFNAESEESGSDEISKEALNQIALQQYAKALELQRKGNLTDATQLLKDLLETELLYEVKKPAKGEKVVDPLFNLKYLCYKNLALMLQAAGELDSAIEAYTSASELDDSDVTLWKRLGEVSMEAKNFEVALYAFKRGFERNPRHWPCIDKLVTLLLGLSYKEQCIAVIYEALQLDPGYMRGIVYRRYIYTVYRHMREYMTYINPLYKWNEADDEPIDEEKAEKLLKEAHEIQEISIEQRQAEAFKSVIPQLKLQKPISNFTWKSVGDSLIHMHNYITENSLSHACHIEIVFEKESPMEVCDEAKDLEPTEIKEENVIEDNGKLTETISDTENNDLSDKSDKDKPDASTDKVESDIEIAATEPMAEPARDVSEKLQKKVMVRRRGSAVSSLGVWAWYKRKSQRKKPPNTISDKLRRLVPPALIQEVIEKENKEPKETSTDVANLEKLFDEKGKEIDNEEYFGECEQKDVKAFIYKYTGNNKDIIDLLNDYLFILCDTYKLKWPEGLCKVYIEANRCYSTHIDIPSCTDDNHDNLIHFVSVNMLSEELMVNEKLKLASNNIVSHELNIVESIEVILAQKPNIYPGADWLEMTLRSLWLKVHIHFINKCEEFALECLYQLLNEFEAMGESHNTFSLKLINFTFDPDINENEVIKNISRLERNIKLSTVVDLYNQNNFDDVLSILIESFEYCKVAARKQDEKMILDFAVHMCIIIESYWALNKEDCCFKWAFKCLHETLKHYFHIPSVSKEFQKWTRTTIKILCCIEHVISTVGLSSLEFLSEEELSQGIEDLIRIIGHQLELNSSDTPFDIVSPWILLHYILQREEDRGRSRSSSEDNVENDDVPDPLKVLFMGHEQLGNKKWCCKSDYKLLYFILDTIVPRLRTPALAKSLERIIPYMEQVVVCLYGLPIKKSNKTTTYKYRSDHGQNGSQTLDWYRAQQLYEIFRPAELPELPGKTPAISTDVEGLFDHILSFLPEENNPSKYVPEIEKYINGIENKLPSFPTLLPHKIKDIYLISSYYHFKKKDYETTIKYNLLDVVINKDRFFSWAQIALAKAAILDNALIVLKKFNAETDFLNPAKSTIRCFKRAVELDPKTSYLWVEYGTFVYRVHSFCSRVLKQASESLSMDDFAALEKQKEDYLDITLNCLTVLEDLNNSSDSDKSDNWLLYYTLGKVAEKRNKPPSVYLNFYLHGVKSLQEMGATYPTKINYNTPTHLCLEVLELQYRIHASILKYIEQHENKPIPASVGKVFINCLEEWLQGPYSKKKKSNDAEIKNDTTLEAHSIQAANILKRSVSDAGEEDTHEAKRLKMEAAAAKVRRSASYDTELIGNKDSNLLNTVDNIDSEKDTNIMDIDKSEVFEPTTNTFKGPDDITLKVLPEENKEDDKKDETSSSSSSSSSSDSNSSESSSDSSSNSSVDTDASSKSSQDTKPITDEEIEKITFACLDALEDCASRYPRHYKALYRLAHYHFYSKKGKDIERCRDLMLSNFKSRSEQKMSGLFSERKAKNFFNNIWKVPSTDVERPGGFASHMNRSVLLTLEILKEIDDHKTLLEISLHLQKDPDKDKQYLRDSDRIDLAQQAFSLCIQSLKGQLLRFSQQTDLKTNDVERQALKSFFSEIYNAYSKLPKQTNLTRNSQQLVNLLVDAYKLLITIPITENMNLVDLSMKYGSSLKQQATAASVDKSQNIQKKQNVKSTDIDKPKVVASVPSQSKVDKPQSSSSSVMPKKSSHEMGFQSYMPMLNDSLLSQQTAAALSYFSNMNALANYASLQNTLQSTLSSSFQNSYQAEWFRHILTPYTHQKKKRGPKSLSRSLSSGASQIKSKSYPVSTASLTKAASTSMMKSATSVITSVPKSSTQIAPSMGTVLSTLPASMSANLSSFGAHPSVPQAHMSTSSASTSVHTKPPMPHQQGSPGKTLQEKLAERQKNLPAKTPSQEINASISRLPSSLTITKTSVPKQPLVHGKKPDAETRPKPISSDVVIVLDDD